MVKKKVEQPKHKSVKAKKRRETDFKPGDKPFYLYDGVVLNADVPWRDIVLSLMECGCSRAKIARYIQQPNRVVKAVLNHDYQQLTFRSGARLLTLHSRYFPLMD